MIMKEAYCTFHGRKTHKDEMEYTFVKDNIVLWPFPPQNGGIALSL
jgi:hypothetical protein